MVLHLHLIIALHQRRRIIPRILVPSLSLLLKNIQKRRAKEEGYIISDLIHSTAGAANTSNAIIKWLR